MNKVALITGITGQDGAYLAEFLLKKVWGARHQASDSITISSVSQKPKQPLEVMGEL